MISKERTQIGTTTLWGLAEERAVLGDKVLLAIGDDAISYGELRDRAAAVAGGLRASGVGPGDRVASYGYNSTDAVVLWFACANLGAVWVPVNVSLIGPDLAYTLSDSAPVALVIDGELLDRLGELEDAPKLDSLYVRGADGAGHPAFEELFAARPTGKPQEIKPSDPMAVIYTGGSTGMPKGVLVSHAYYIGSGIRYAEVGETEETDVHYSGGHQLFHSGGQQLGVIGPMFSGMTSRMERWFSASQYWRHAREAGATVIDPIGPLMGALLRQPPSPDDRSHCVRVGIGSATGQIPRSMRDEFQDRFRVPLLEVYAQTETGGVLMCSERLDSRRPGSAGRTYGWAQIGIVDEQDNLLPPNQTGEIVVRPLVPHTFMIEYINKPEQTLQSWRNLWHHTGDVGYLDDDEYLFFVGRQAHWMRRRGENVSAFEVEHCLMTLEGVVECAVVGVPDLEIGDEEIKAYIVRDQAVPIDEDRVAGWCSERLAYFKVPRYIEFVESLPRSGAKGEVERHRLRDRGIGVCWDARDHTVGLPRGPASAKASEATS